MATKIDTSMAPLNLHSTPPSISPKLSKFGIKSGFVIPKNKLSGSLVPVFRTSHKTDSTKNIKEESNSKVQRRTKWGIDMTQHTSIKKGRLLAYQTRLEQITKQLKMDSGSHQDLKFQSVSATSTQDPSKYLIIDEIQDQNLELEMREVIGEILQINPSYNTPLDYKPLLKEAKVPIPIEVHSEFNFIRLLLDLESNTQKRLEEETGAKIKVYGTKSDTKEKCQITQSDINEETQSTYEEAHVLVSADNYNKIDAAVALLELLFTPASVNPAVSITPMISTTALDSGITYNPGLIQSTPSYTVIKPSTISQAASPTVHAPANSCSMQYETYDGTWFSENPTNAALQPSSSYMPSQNTPFLGVNYPFVSVSNSPDVVSVPHPPNQLPYHCPAFTPTTFLAVNQPTPLGTSQTLSQPIPMAPMGTHPNRPLAPPIISPVGASNTQMKPHPQNPIISSPCQQNQRLNFPSQSSFPVQPSTRPSVHEMTFMSGPRSMSLSALSHNNAISVQHPGSSQLASLPMVPHQPLTGMVLNKSQGPSPMIVPRPPPRPVSCDFTFQPLRSQVAAPLNQSQISVFAGCGSSYQTSSQIPFDLAQSALHQNSSQMWTRAPPFIPQMPRPAPLGAIGHGSSAQLGHFPNIRLPSSLHFPNSQNVDAPITPSLNQRGPLSYFPDHRISILQGTRPPLQTLHPPQNPIVPSTQSHGFLVQNRPIGSFGSGQFGNPVYNPLSPSPVQNASLQKRNEQTNVIVSSDPDPEYDDLMASVGVR